MCEVGEPGNKATSEHVYFFCSYIWLKKSSATQTWKPYRQTKSGELIFDTLSAEDNGYYICQAQVDGQFVETNEVNVTGKKRFMCF